MGRAAVDCAFCQNQDLRDFQDFRFAKPALFAITENPAKMNVDERLHVADAREES